MQMVLRGTKNYNLREIFTELNTVYIVKTVNKERFLMSMLLNHQTIDLKPIVSPIDRPTDDISLQFGELIFFQFSHL